MELQRAADAERNMQLLSRSLTGGVISERDRLLEYSVGAFYQEMSLFIQEQETRQKELDKIYNK